MDYIDVIVSYDIDRSIEKSDVLKFMDSDSVDLIYKTEPAFGIAREKYRLYGEDMVAFLIKFKQATRHEEFCPKGYDGTYWYDVFNKTFVH